MKYTDEQKEFYKTKEMAGFNDYFKNVNTDPKQQEIQQMIDNYYPIPEKFEIYESKMNK
jgi:hypothetical protein